MCKATCPTPVPGGGCLLHPTPPHFCSENPKTQVWEPVASTLAAELGECACTTATGMVSVPCGSQSSANLVPGKSLLKSLHPNPYT